jgi:hypothetical protein
LPTLFTKKYTWQFNVIKLPTHCQAFFKTFLIYFNFFLNIPCIFAYN